MSDPNKSWPDEPVWSCGTCDFWCTSEAYKAGHEGVYHHRLYFGPLGPAR